MPTLLFIHQYYLKHGIKSSSFEQGLRPFTHHLLELIALSLGLPPSTFAAHHDPDKANFDNFELMHYPPHELSTANESGASFCITPHTDFGAITLLMQSGVEGLEVRPPHYTSATLDFVTEE
jgi:isopenicillin N synthase-like dioxygenase